ncbi:ABC transporter permease [Actinacidiphila alni]|uniref:ABC transporter permease n=1 Tax=Actinacidiphila alni TaxID=380248 RepID=UPI0033E2E8C2
MNAYFDMPSDLQHSYLGLIGLHLREALLPVLFGLVVALPVAQLCVRFKWLYSPVLWVTTVLYAIPSLAFFVVLIDYTGATETTVMIPLTVYSLVLLVPAIVDGVRSVSPDTMAAATAMGFGPVQRYLKVQLPIAVPAIFAGLRLAAVSSISLVSVGTLIGNQGALGNLLADGQFYHRTPLIVTSVVTTALLAILVDGLLVLVQTLLTPWAPRGGKSAGRSGRTSLLRRRTTSAAREPEPAAARAALEDAVR